MSSIHVPFDGVARRGPATTTPPAPAPVDRPDRRPRLPWRPRGPLRTRLTRRPGDFLPSRVARALSIFYPLAYFICVAMQPEPNGSDPHTRWWMPVLDISSLAVTILAAVAIYHLSRHAAWLGLLTGAGFIAETITCPLSDHHRTGWWTDLQAGLSAAVTTAAVGVCFAVLTTPSRTRKPTHAA